MTEEPTKKHTLDFDIGEATQRLTGYEILAIEKHFGRGMEELHSVELMIGTIWAYESRRAGKPVSWTIPCNMTVRELGDYFNNETIGDDEGKAPTNGEPGISLDGVWQPDSDQKFSTA